MIVTQKKSQTGQEELYCYACGIEMKKPQIKGLSIICEHCDAIN